MANIILNIFLLTAFNFNVIVAGLIEMLFAGNGLAAAAAAAANSSGGGIKCSCFAETPSVQAACAQGLTDRTAFNRLLDDS